MAFMIECIDKADGLPLRLKTRPDHLAYLQERIGHILIAGPLLAADGETPVGSMLVVDFATRAEVDAFAAADPYAQVGLFQRTTITPFKKVLP
jgi:uncharacterized protein YciI